MKNNILLIGSFFGFLSILFGAIGSHLLEDQLFWSQRIDTFELAVRYQFYHVFLLLILGLSYDFFEKKYIHYAFYSCVAGIILFSGSLYTLCLTNISLFGSITPIGGLCLMLAWALFSISIFRSLNN